jgi:hypothetical protein
MSLHPISRRNLVIILVILSFLAVAIAALTPLEKTLGGNLRLVYLHGAWVWTGIITFSVSALTGIAALFTRKNFLHNLSRTSGWSGMCFWLSYLPMSLAVMKINWNGFFFDEPRWKIPFTFAVIGLLLQAGVYLVTTNWITSLANLIYGSALVYNLMKMDSVLHPGSPVFSSESSEINVVFILLFAVTLLMSTILTSIWLVSFPGNKLRPVEEV